MVAGWVIIVLICIGKSLMVWNAGISNKTEKVGWRYWVVYGFHELSIASLLYMHFYLFEFFYFSKVSPCFSIQAFNGIEPYFDSILYLFLSKCKIIQITSKAIWPRFSQLCVSFLCFYSEVLYTTLHSLVTMLKISLGYSLSSSESYHSVPFLLSAE
jgi:hypothetical protein